ncbi:TetR family transcriptional regulator [Gordonia sp. SID5947]|uniref:TetR/AcrR family transcriptional regulator n=1 Tax=Gordonia sp. SID5947 TaxID=2690315 RepID=UPI00136DB6B0|nr:TetR/AcrR family transcriptional regulator [Gordonia sp. SID5947]MYR07350.1 TetR family transcriptional regulator [Gordonia sp. SID5947]
MSTHRRRGPELERAILDAVREQVDRHGYTSITYEGIAAAAGTGKAVLYRRWATKAQMVLAAMAADEQIDLTFTVDTGSLTGDLELALRGGRDILDRRREMVAGLLADFRPDDSGWGSHCSPTASAMCSARFSHRPARAESSATRLSHPGSCPCR